MKNYIVIFFLKKKGSVEGWQAIRNARNFDEEMNWRCAIRCDINELFMPNYPNEKEKKSLMNFVGSRLSSSKFFGRMQNM